MDITDDKGKVIAKVTAADPNQDGCDEGVWVELQADDGTRPTLCMIKEKAKGQWYLGVYRDVRKIGLSACDLAVTFDPALGPQLQVVKGGAVRTVSLFDLAGSIMSKG